MNNWHNYDTLLELVEDFAYGQDWIANEEELSKLFDLDILPHVIEQYSVEDQTAINEAFNDWTDALCKDGTIHPEQYDKYCYVGRLTED